MRKILFLITFLPLWLVGSVGYAQGGADDPLKFKVTVTDSNPDEDGGVVMTSTRRMILFYLPSVSQTIPY